MAKYRHRFFLLIIILSSTFSLHAAEVTKPTTQQLLNPDWIEKQFKKIGIDQLVALYNGQKQKDVLLVKSALDLSRGVISKHPHALRSQLQARLISHQQPSLQAFQQLPKDHVQIVSLTPLLAQAGGPLIRSYSNGKNGVIFAEFVASGNQIMTMTKKGTVQFFEASSGNKLRSFETKMPSFRAVITDNQKTLVILGRKRQIAVWDLKSGKLRHRFGDPRLLPITIMLSNDGTKLITRTNKRQMICWDIQTGKKLHSFNKYQDNAPLITISPDSSLLVIAKRYTYVVFDMATGRKLINILPQKKGSAPQRIAITTDNQYVIIEKRNSFELLNLNTGENRVYNNANFPQHVFSQMVFSVKEEKIIASLDGKTQYVWNIKTGKMVKAHLNIPLWLKPTSLSSDGKLSIGTGANGQIILYDLQKTKKTNHLGRKQIAINCLETSVNEKIIITGGNGNLVNVWDFKTLKLIKSMKGHTGSVESIAITPDGKRAVSRSLDGFIRLWDVKTGKTLKKIQHGFVTKSAGYARPSVSPFSALSLQIMPTYMLISPNGKEVISQFRSKTLRKGTVATPIFCLGTWNLHTGKMRSHENSTLAHNVNQAVLVPDGKQILTTGRDNQVGIWDYQSSLKQLNNIKHVFNYQRTTSKIHHLAISTDGKQIVSSAEDGVISLWNVQKEKTTNAMITWYFHWHDGFIKLLKFLPGNQLVLSASVSNTYRFGVGAKVNQIGKIIHLQQDNSIRIWNYKTNKLITTFYLDFGFRSITLSPSGKHILIGTQYGQLHKLRIDNLQISNGK